MENPDWNDSYVLSDRANACVDIANRYRHARQKYAEAKRFLDLRVALALRRTVRSS
jgi:hypothetical protein